MKATLLKGVLLSAGLTLYASMASGQPASGCDRTCLENHMERYWDALIHDDPLRVPLAPTVKFTENGQRLPIGEGLWKSLRSVSDYRLWVTDADAGQVTLITTIEERDRTPESGVPAVAFFRLRVQNGTITEIEQIVERSEQAAQRIEALGAPREAFTRAVPANERMSRSDLIRTADYYFTGMQRNDGQGYYPFADHCHRIENGSITTNVPTPEGQSRPDPLTSTSYSAQWSCLEQFESGLLYFVSRIRDRRYVAVDQERGLVMVVAFFDHMAGSTREFTTPDGRQITAGPAQPWTWYIAEVFKIENGLLGEIEAILNRSPYGMLSGWSSWDDGMSDRARDVTGYIETR
jgi:hypothetical protein